MPQNWATDLDKEATRVQDANYGVRVRYNRQYSATITAPMVSSGYLKFVLLTAGWFCDQCGEKVVPSKFKAHVKKAH